MVSDPGSKNYREVKRDRTPSKGVQSPEVRVPKPSSGRQSSTSV